MGKQYTLADLPEALVARMIGPVPPPDFVSNGITCGPQSWRGCLILVAGHFHDYHYSDHRPLAVKYGVSNDKKMRAKADAIFYYNNCLLGLTNFEAGFLYRRVRLWGIPHFAWDPGEKPSGFWIYASLFLNRYKLSV